MIRVLFSELTVVALAAGIFDAKANVDDRIFLLAELAENVT